MGEAVNAHFKAFKLTSRDVSGRIGMGTNEYGTPVTVFVCQECGSVFSVTGEHTTESWGAFCLADECDSYDVERDAGLMFDIEPWRISRDEVTE